MLSLAFGETTGISCCSTSPGTPAPEAVFAAASDRTPRVVSLAPEDAGALSSIPDELAPDCRLCVSAGRFEGCIAVSEDAATPLEFGRGRAASEPGGAAGARSMEDEDDDAAPVT